MFSCVDTSNDNTNEIDEKNNSKLYSAMIGTWVNDKADSDISGSYKISEANGSTFSFASDGNWTYKYNSRSYGKRRSNIN